MYWWVPAPATTSVTSTVPSLSQSMAIVPASATVTSYVGVVSLVMWSVLLAPVSLPVCRLTVTLVARSIVMPSATDGPDSFPAASTAPTV